MARSRNFSIPRKPFNPRVVHLYDIVAMVLVFALAQSLMPVGHTLDFSAGFNQKSEAYLQTERQQLVSLFEDDTISRYSFRGLFRTSCLQNGGYVYSDGDENYFYKTGDQGTGYYCPDEEGNLERVDTRDVDNPRGLIVDGVYLSVMEDGQIFLDDLEGNSDLMDAYVDVSGELDFAQIGRIMCSDEISYRDAAMLWQLIQQETIIGFDGSAVWLQEVSEDVHHFYRATENEVEDMGTLEGELWDVMVINDRYMIYAKNGNLYIRAVESGESTYIPFDEWTDLGELEQLAYWVGVNGKVRVYALNSVHVTYYDLSGSDLEIDQMIKMDSFTTENINGMYITGTQAFPVIWFREPGQYTHITQD